MYSIVRTVRSKLTFRPSRCTTLEPLYIRKYTTIVDKGFSEDFQNEDYLREGIDRLTTHLYVDMAVNNDSQEKDTVEPSKLFLSEQGSPMVWTADGIGLKEVVDFMVSRGASITPYILHYRGKK